MCASRIDSIVIRIDSIVRKTNSVKKPTRLSAKPTRSKNRLIVLRIDSIVIKIDSICAAFDSIVRKTDSIVVKIDSIECPQNRLGQKTRLDCDINRLDLCHFRKISTRLRHVPLDILTFNFYHPQFTDSTSFELIFQKSSGSLNNREDSHSPLDHTHWACAVTRLVLVVVCCLFCFICLLLVC